MRDMRRARAAAWVGMLQAGCAAAPFSLLFEIFALIISGVSCTASANMAAPAASEPVNQF